MFHVIITCLPLSFSRVFTLVPYRCWNKLSQIQCLKITQIQYLTVPHIRNEKKKWISEAEIQVAAGLHFLLKVLWENQFPCLSSFGSAPAFPYSCPFHLQSQQWLSNALSYHMALTLPMIKTLVMTLPTWIIHNNPHLQVTGLIILIPSETFISPLSCNIHNLSGNIIAISWD